MMRRSTASLVSRARARWLTPPLLINTSMGPAASRACRAAASSEAVSARSSGSTTCRSGWAQAACTSRSRTARRAERINRAPRVASAYARASPIPDAVIQTISPSNFHLSLENNPSRFPISSDILNECADALNGPALQMKAARKPSRGGTFTASLGLGALLSHTLLWIHAVR